MFAPTIMNLMNSAHIQLAVLSWLLAVYKKNMNFNRKELQQKYTITLISFITCMLYISLKTALNKRKYKRIFEL